MGHTVLHYRMGQWIVPPFDHPVVILIVWGKNHLILCFYFSKLKSSIFLRIQTQTINDRTHFIVPSYYVNDFTMQ